MKQCIFKLVSFICQHLLAYVVKYVWKVLGERKQQDLTQSELFDLLRIGNEWERVSDVVSSYIKKDE